MMRADRIINKAGAPCTDRKRVTFELGRVCPWCMKARREKVEADDAARIGPEKRTKPMPDYHCKSESCYGERQNDVRVKQHRIESEGLGVNLSDG